ncbi:MAG: hypothetical protein WBW98_03025 [Candidatus Sulfotelmatobacter sp.]|jgi:hypothetical protein
MSSVKPIAESGFLVAGPVYDFLDQLLDLIARRSAASTTLESRISSIRAGSAVHDGC